MPKPFLLERQAQYAVGACLLVVVTSEQRERVCERLRALEIREPIAGRPGRLELKSETPPSSASSR